ncbi:MAG: hypothetical protein ACE5NM_11880 [Sedimentisphaerales bacterium]
MFRFEINHKSAPHQNTKRWVSRTCLLVLFWCGGLLTCGCATLYVQPASVRQDTVEVTVTADWPHTPDGLAIIGLPPKTIGISLNRAGKLIETANVNLNKGKYTYTFANVEQDSEYIIEPHTFVVFEVGQGAGPYKIPSVPSVPSAPDVSYYQRGYKRAMEYRNEQIQDYRIVIELRLLSEVNRNEFLRGFDEAYAEANDSARGKKLVFFLKQSVRGGVYEQAFEIGKKHVNSQITDSFIQTMIRRSLGLGGFELGWKAGYIEGCVQEIFKKKGGNKKDLYQKAEIIYNSFKNAL